jgi:hypothetical protein
VDAQRGSTGAICSYILIRQAALSCYVAHEVPRFVFVRLPTFRVRQIRWSNGGISFANPPSILTLYLNVSFEPHPSNADKRFERLFRAELAVAVP